ncbi:flavin reductase family protein [Xanthobacter autotrophicus]|uniref:flavin reductase family protein n=1 Tax=Xanthobacter autotrophicus TaxID=280 RepID=UPI001E2BDE0D|nr:flavin reductase family protein [Xanthobacter autotrophicus]UDQ91268.1 flavin reductase family protein [Xanthobacter autotrophicus]
MSAAAEISPVDAGLFRDAMRRMASGVAVIATDGPAGRAGLTVSSLASLCMEPPSVILCIHEQSNALKVIEANGVFVANVLAHHQSHVSDTFAGQVPQFRDDKFACADWRAAQSGAPVLDGALMSFDCRLATHHAYGTHRIVVGAVTAVHGLEDEAEPLLYANRAYRRLTAA